MKIITIDRVVEEGGIMIKYRRFNLTAPTKELSEKASVNTRIIFRPSKTSFSTAGPSISFLIHLALAAPATSFDFPCFPTVSPEGENCDLRYLSRALNALPRTELMLKIE